MQPTQLGDGDIMGDGILGPETPESIKDPEQEMNESLEDQSEGAIRQQLVEDAYGTKQVQRRNVDRNDN